MMRNKGILKAARLIESLGAEVSMQIGPNGLFFVSPEELVKAVNDPNGWLSKQHGIGRDLYVKWRAYMDGEERCTGVTRFGKQCRRRGEDYARPEEFVPGFHDRCLTHKET